MEATNSTSLLTATDTQCLRPQRKTSNMHSCLKYPNRPKQSKRLTSTSSRLLLNRKSLVLGAILISIAVFVLNPAASSDQLVEGKKAKKAIKTLVKGLVLQNLSTRKNFLPLPVPIPVPIEINDPPVYLKGKPKYVNVYKQPKPTKQPVVKPTTVYHMPVYSPTYEYMSMSDPMSMYGAAAAAMMYPQAAMPAGFGGSLSGVKSSVQTDADSTSSSAGVNFNDYDDDFGNYYMRRSRAAAAQAAKRRRLAASPEVEADVDITDHQLKKRRDEEALAGPLQTMLLPSEDEERVDNDASSQLEHRKHHLRTKRQVYYQSGYDGERQCHGFPLEINVRSRIKMDQVFPIHGKSQFKKCIKVGKPLLPPVEDHGPSYS